MRYLVSVSMIALLSTALTACVTGAPKPMPRGYASFTQTYKSAPGPQARTIGYAYDKNKNDTVIEDLRFAAVDLVEKLDQTLSFTNDRIYLSPPEQSAFYSSFDFLLREELIKRGYVISAVPSAGTIPVTFVAKEITQENNQKNMPKAAYRNLYLALAFDVSNGTANRFIGSTYEVPTYDFKPTKSITLATAPAASTPSSGITPTTAEILAPIPVSETAPVAKTGAPISLIGTP
jgi:hypothetical protein